MLMCLCMTRPGQHAMGYFIAKLWPRWNFYATDRIVRVNPEHANRVVLRHMAEESAVQAATNNRITYAGFEISFEVTRTEPIRNALSEELVLRTKTFRYDDTTNHKSVINENKDTLEGENVSNKLEEDDDDEKSDVSDSSETMEEKPSARMSEEDTTR